MSGQQLEPAVVSDEIKSFVGAIQALVAVEAERDAALDAVERLRAESADRIQVKVRLMAERDQAWAAVERVRELCDEADHEAWVETRVSVRRLRAALEGPTINSELPVAGESS